MRFDPVNSDSVGEPLYCSTRRIDFDKNINQSIAYEADTIFNGGDYDEMETPHKLFATNGNKYYLYADDFRWNSKEESNCVFPGRMVVTRKKGKLEIVWSKSLDLFGIPCD